MEEVKVFVSSREQELNYERAASSEVISELSMQPILFEKYKASTNDNTHQAYLSKIKDCQIFVLIIWKSISDAVLNEYKEAVKQHKPILILERKLEYDEKRDSRLEQFLKDLRKDNFQDGRNSVIRTFDSLNGFKANLKASIKEEIKKAFNKSFKFSYRDEMYNEGAVLVKNSKKRLYIFQRKAALFYVNKDLRDSYGDVEPELRFRDFEINFSNTLREWIKDIRALKIDDVKFVYVFDRALTMQKLAKISNPMAKEAIINAFKTNLIKYKDIEKESNYNFQFTTLEAPISGPLMIADNNFGLWILGKEDSISFYQDNERISSKLAEGLDHELNKRQIKSYNDIITELGI